MSLQPRNSTTTQTSNPLTNETRIEGDEPSILGPFDHEAQRRSLESKSVRKEEQNGKSEGAPKAAALYIHANGHIDRNAPAAIHTLESP